VKRYDTVSDDFALQEALVSAYARSGERAPLDKLIAIVTTETKVNVRRRAISALSNSDTLRARQALKDIVTR
jgi:HEAT repeat protein